WISVLEMHSRGHFFDFFRLFVLEIQSREHFSGFFSFSVPEIQSRGHFSDSFWNFVLENQSRVQIHEKRSLTLQIIFIKIKKPPTCMNHVEGLSYLKVSFLKFIITKQLPYHPFETLFPLLKPQSQGFAK